MWNAYSFSWKFSSRTLNAAKGHHSAVHVDKIDANGHTPRQMPIAALLWPQRLLLAGSGGLAPIHAHRCRL
ncbi:hypothetical protein Pelo_19860 [Pelomyxa schiedti]|nr:hypothetical protein Pelo_19860 [Pelomyxa schiedti]